MEHRRQFLRLVILSLAASATRCSQGSPTAPTAVQPVTATPTPSNLTSMYGTLYRTGFAGIEGTLEQVLTASGYRPTISGNLITHLDGRPAPEIFINGRRLNDELGNARRGYFFYIRGERLGNSVASTRLAPRDQWHAFDWNGYEFRNV